MTLYAMPCKFGCDALVLVLPGRLEDYGGDFYLVLAIEHMRQFHPDMVGIDVEAERRKANEAYLRAFHSN